MGLCLYIYKIYVKQPRHQSTLHLPSNPKTRGSVPQLLKQIVNLFCYFCFQLKFSQRRVEHKMVGILPTHGIDPVDPFSQD